MRKLILALILWPSLALAEGLPKPASTTVNDWAEVISPAVEDQLATTLADARRETGVHVVVVTMNDQADFGGAGQSLETYATNLFNAWGIGERTRNDGVLILVTPGRRAMRIELGTGFGSHWDETAKGIIDDTFLPAFAEGQIESGIRRGTDQVLDRIARPFVKDEKPSFGLGFFEIGFIAFVAAFIFGRSPWRWIGDRMTNFRACPSCGRRGLRRDHETEFEATADQPGQGATTTLCRYCAYRDRRDFVIPIPSSGSSSSGFGGGSSSGGGASGRW